MELNTGKSQPFETDKQNNEKACLIFNVRLGAPIADVTHGIACSIGEREYFIFDAVCQLPMLAECCVLSFINLGGFISSYAWFNEFGSGWWVKVDTVSTASFSYPSHQQIFCAAKQVVTAYINALPGNAFPGIILVWLRVTGTLH